MDDDPEFDIAITARGTTVRVSRKVLRAAVSAALRRHGTKTARISLALVDDALIAQLHSAHLKKSGPTDVLSFDLSDRVDDEFGARDRREIDGEIVMSLETAAREARSRGHTVDAEAALYAVHGALHLLGYEDADAASAKRMHELEDEILSTVGLGAVFWKRAR